MKTVAERRAEAKKQGEAVKVSHKAGVENATKQGSTKRQIENQKGAKLTTTSVKNDNTAGKTRRLTPTRLASIVAGIISAVGLAYAGLAGVWGLPYAEEIQSTCGVVVSFISAILAVFTGKKLASK